MKVYSQLTLVSLDALSGTEALPCVDMTYVGVAVTLACCKERQRLKEGDGERERCIKILSLKSLSVLLV